MSFLNGLFGETINEKKRNLVRLIYITATVVLLISLTLAITLIATSVANDSTDDNASDTDTNRGGAVVEYTFDDTKMGTLLLINKNTTAYDFTLNPESKLVKISENIAKADGAAIYSLRYDTLLAHPDALSALNEMVKDFYAESPDAAKKLTVWTAYRSYAAQEALGSSVGAGHSDFHTGMLFELTVNGSATSVSTDSAFDWIYENAYKYGFVERYPESKSSSTGISDFDNAFRYVGTAHATYMKENGLCLEEYVALLKQNEGKTLNAGGFKITYVKANEFGATELTVPARATVSGDNEGGLVIASK